MKINGVLDSKLRALAEEMNTLFSTIGSTINNYFSNSSSYEYLQYLPSSSLHSLFLNPVNEYEVHRVISTLKCKSVGIDAIPVRVIRFLSPIISLVVSFLINKTFSEGDFLTAFELAKLVLIHKGGQADDINNYRPISILNNFSKVFEKCMHRRLYSYLD